MQKFTSLLIVVGLLGCGNQNQEEIEKRVVNIKAALINPPIRRLEMLRRVEEITKDAQDIKKLVGGNVLSNEHAAAVQKALLDVTPGVEAYFRNIAAESRKRDGEYESGLYASDRHVLCVLFNYTLGNVNRTNQSCLDYFREINIRFRDGQF